MATSKYIQDFNSAFKDLASVVNKINHATTVSELNLAQREARGVLQLVQFRALDLARWVETETSLRRKTLRETTFLEVIDAHTPVEEIPVAVPPKKKTAKRIKKETKKAK